MRPRLRVNEIVSIYSPTSEGRSVIEDSKASHWKTTTGNPTPQTILLFSWGDANPRHIEKYTTMYTVIWPEAEIIVVESGIADFFYRTEKTLRRLLEPVVEMLNKRANDTLLVHVMSNAGSKQWCMLNNLFSQSTGRSLSNVITIVDSAPGRAKFEQTWAALVGSLPKALIPRMTLGFIFGIVLSIMHLANLFVPGFDVIETTRTQMNSPSEAVTGTRRCYIYSEEDKIIGWQDIEDHADDAKRKGWTVELVKFQGSTHVGHFKQDPERYQDTIRRMWDGKTS